MKQSTAIDIALTCMDYEAQKLYSRKDDKSREQLERIREAMKIIKVLGQQGRMEL